jgi:hypothetical protein
MKKTSTFAHILRNKKFQDQADKRTDNAPSPEVIEQRAAKIREKWDKQTREQRTVLGVVRVNWLDKVVPTRH